MDGGGCGSKEFCAVEYDGESLGGCTAPPCSSVSCLHHAGHQYFFCFLFVFNHSLQADTSIFLYGNLSLLRMEKVKIWKISQALVYVRYDFI